MTYEMEIPEYALQPAKAPQVVQTEAIYHTEKIHYPAESRTVSCQIEEDILVPDTKADMRNILFMHADCDVTPEERKLIPKADDFVELTGMITLQTLYQPEEIPGRVIGITSKIPYKYSWNLSPETPGDGVLSCKVKTLDYMVINERKFRVKITLEFSVQVFKLQELRFFDGLKEDALEMKKVEMPLVCLAAVKKDCVTIDESLRLREGEHVPENLLKQSFLITENYRQITTEKIVINGFIFVHLLFLSEGGDGQDCSLCEVHQRIEFTQFIPIDKNLRSKKWSTVKTAFSSHNLKVSIEAGEDGASLASFRIHGDIDTRVELYEVKAKDMVIDAYHREKNFCCKFNGTTFRNLAGSTTAECGLREIVSLRDDYAAVDAVSCDGNISTWSCRCEKGKIFAEGILETICLWKDSEGKYHGTRHNARFQHMLDADYTETGITAECRPVLKNCSISLINEKQLELNASILLSFDLFAEKELMILEEPGFTPNGTQKAFSMVVTMLKPGESLWDLAKRYRTTETHIRTVNQLENEPEIGQKILVMR